MNSLHDLWDRICDYCQSSIQSTAYTTWIKTLTPISIRNKDVKIKAPSIFQKSIVEANYMTLLQDAFKDIFGFEVNITIICEDQIEDSQEIKTPGKEKDNVLSTYTFENFIVGESNRFAYSGARAVAKNPGKEYNPFFIYGNSGLGKTHLLNAIYNEIKINNPKLNLVFTTAENYTNELVSAIMHDDNSNFREKYRNTDVLFIDDIHFLARKESAQEEFFNTFNSLYLNDKQIIVTSDRPPKEIPSLAERIRARFEQGLITDIQNPDFETRVAILNHKAQNLNLHIPDNIIIYIAEQLKSNIRQLEGIVKKLHAYSQLTGEPTNMPVVINSIKDIKNNDQPLPLTIEKIIETVEHYYNIKPGSLASSKQTKDISLARQIAIYICRDLTDATLTELGNSFGRDHSSISYALSQMDEKLVQSPSYKSVIKEIENNINED